MAKATATTATPTDITTVNTTSAKTSQSKRHSTLIYVFVSQKGLNVVSYDFLGQNPIMELLIAANETGKNINSVNLNSVFHYIQ